MKIKYENLGRCAVTGGAGFIGSHLVDNLISNQIPVQVIDNLSSGKMSNLEESLNNTNFNFFNYDLGNNEPSNDFLNNTKTVFHLAADPEVRTGYDHPDFSFSQNVVNTFNLLEQIRKSSVETLFFTSTSTVYGEPDTIPTSEDYGPLLPISHYGASKLACESLISSYCHSYGIRGVILRLANIVGFRSGHGVVFDFIQKLRKDKTKLEILGDGTQSKSYVHISDCVDCILSCLSIKDKQVNVYNLGNSDRIDVKMIGKIVSTAMQYDNTEIITTGGVDNGRGWVGDVKIMELDGSRLKKLGWIPKLSSIETIETAAQELILNKKVV